MGTVTGSLRAADEVLTSVFDRAFAPAHNPWRHLGALSFLCLVAAVASGIVAYALFDSSVAGAYDSGLRLQNDPWFMGRLLRGIH
ncbi:MAG: methyl-viologen-reducing hydrogenase subunit delta, partial [Betaproteobacteria bacterium]